MNRGYETTTGLAESIANLIINEEDEGISQDMHIHTELSDGNRNPSDILKLAREASLDLIAITDHNNMNAITQIISNAKSFPHDPVIIPGIELSTGWKGTRVHVLGYFPDLDLNFVPSIVEKIRRGHWERERRRIKRLQKTLGLKITEQHLKDIVGRGIPNWKFVAAALVAAGDAKSIEEASENYLQKGRIGYVSYKEDWPKASPEEAVRMVVSDYGLASIAHPGDIESSVGTEETVALISELKKCGLEGFDTSHRKTENPMSFELSNILERQLKLLRIVGNDSHEGNLKDGAHTANLALPILMVSKIFKKYSSLFQGYSLGTCVQPLILPEKDFFRLPIGILSKLNAEKHYDLERISRKMALLSPSSKPSREEVLLASFALAERLVNKQTEVALAKYVNNLHPRFRKNDDYLYGKFRDLFMKRILLLEEMESKNHLMDNELITNLQYYCPVAYRLSFYDEGATIRDRSLSALKPKHFELFLEFYEYITQSWSNYSQSKVAEEIAEAISKKIRASKRIRICEVLIRPRKSAASAYKKFVECWLNGCDVKNKKKSAEAQFLLGTFNEWVKGNRIKIGPEVLMDNLVQAIFEDLIAITFIAEAPNASILFQELRKVDFADCLDTVDEISFKLRRWYHKRALVWGTKRHIPVEILFKTVDDFWLSRFYYWLTKNTPVFGVKKNLEEARLEATTLKKISLCRSESELQKIALKWLYCSCSKKPQRGG